MQNVVRFIRVSMIDPVKNRITFANIPIIWQELKKLKDEVVDAQNYTIVSKKMCVGQEFVNGLIIVSQPLYTKFRQGELNTAQDWKNAVEQCGFNLLCAVISGVIVSLLAGPQMFLSGFIAGGKIGSLLFDKQSQKVKA